MTDPTEHYSDFGYTLEFFGQLSCVYVVYADDYEVYRSRVFTEALREFRLRTAQINAADGNLGISTRLEVLL